MYEVLEERTGLIAFEVRLIASGRRPHVPFYEVADPLVCAMRCPFVFVDGTLPVLGELPVGLVGTPAEAPVFDLRTAA